MSRRDGQDLTHAAARLYYVEEMTQADVAERLHVSRPTVSRLLADARGRGIVEIIVHDPAEATEPTDEALAQALGVDRVWLASARPGQDRLSALAATVDRALAAAHLSAGDTLLVSSGRTAYDLSRSSLTPRPGIEIAPTVGGVAEPAAWHQTNEITRAMAELLRGRPHFLFAPALPSARMRATLDEDPEFRRVTGLWGAAKAALVGVGAPPASRDSISTFIPLTSRGIRTAAGDISLNFFTADGAEVRFPGHERMVRIGRDQLQALATTIAVATGAVKAVSILAGARAGLFNQLVTDSATARAVLKAAKAP
jgi:DNA-binding transcriptional regulator LsrR (DeoR family)